MEEQKMNETTYEQPQANVKTGAATAALVLGIIALITTLFLVNYIFGLIAIICAVVFLIKSRGVKAGKAKAITGLALASVSVIASTVIWVSIYNYFTQTDLNTIMKDVATITGGEIDPEEIIAQEFDKVLNVEQMPELKAVEEALGKEINYDTLKEFVGEDLNVDKITKFVGDGIDTTKIQEVAETLDYEAVMEDLDQELTYKKLEEKIGEDFTYEDLMEYLEGFKK